MIDFFAKQDAARRRSRVFLLAFFAMTTAVCLTVNILAWQFLPPLDNVPSWNIHLGISLVVWGLVLAGWWWKSYSLRGGGPLVAARLGGRLATREGPAEERQLLNTVEEMAIAAGLPVPLVFMLDEEPGINACAAGFGPEDGTICVTHGALHKLTREQLQGVIAHEMAHISNGDMRLNLRMVCVLHGLLVLALAGEMLLRMTSHGRYTRSRDSKNSGQVVLVILGLGIALWLLGSLGRIAGGMLRAGFSRSRERLADAAAVQFTRNPAGLAGALKRISGGLGARLRSPARSEFAHLFFAHSGNLWDSLWKTHPPLPERIRALDPHWDGSIDTIDLESKDREYRSEQGLAQQQKLRTAEPPQRAEAAAMVGGLFLAQDLLTRLGDDLRLSVADPYTCRAILAALTLSPDGSVRENQIQALRHRCDAATAGYAARYYSQLNSLGTATRLPLIGLAQPGLQQLSHSQRQAFQAGLSAVRQLAPQDISGVVAQTAIMQHLKRAVTPVDQRTLGPQAITDSLRDVLAILCTRGNTNRSAATNAWHAGLGIIDPLGPRPELPTLAQPAIALSTALQQLAQANHSARQLALRALAACAWQDQSLSDEEQELLRLICDLLGAPLPLSGV